LGPIPNPQSPIPKNDIRKLIKKLLIFNFIIIYNLNLNE
jgi:hypothetical protein